MKPRGILTVVNSVLALLAVGVLVALYWFVGRPTPKVSGEIVLPVLARVTVERDERGVPHIAAGSLEDAFFAQGFVTAQDRLWQMDMLRRLAGGELAEIVGPAAIESDTLARKMGLRRIAQLQSASLNPQERAWMAAYARGVNAYLENNRGKWAPEFTLMQYEPRPWTIGDSLLAGLQMFRTLTGTWENEVLKARMLAAGGDPAKVNQLFPVRSGQEVQIGSNAWAISGKHTASGKPILANDPHLEFGIPSVWYLVHLKAPGLNVAGASLPGVPAVIIGHNEQIAWGVTNLHFDVQDLYAERIDPQSGQYLHKGQVLRARQEREVIAVKGGRPVELTTWVTVHGPLFTSFNNQALSFRWTAAEPAPFQFPFVELNQAKDFAGFRKALSRFAGPGQNFVYADRAGNIGYQATGRFPIRRSFTGDVPLDGASGQFEWDGFIPFEELPSVLNPASGYIVTANQNPFPATYPYPVTGNFSSHYRSRQIQDMLHAHEGWKPEDVLKVQKDVYSGFSAFLAKQLVAASEMRQVTNPSVLAAVSLLKKWNGQMEKGTPEPFLLSLAFQHLRRRIAEKAAPKVGSEYASEMAAAAMEKLLRERSQQWFPDWDKMLVEVFADAVEEGTRMQGRNLAKWDYGRYNELSLGHPVARNVPWIGAYWNIGPVPMSGSSTTVKQTTRRIGPSMRFVADLSAWDQTLQNITIGQSGHRLSGHYKDQWEAYYRGASFPMPFEKVAVDNTLTLSPR